MANFTTYLDDKLLDHVTGKTAYTSPTVYVGLSTTTPAVGGTGVTEPVGNGYARVATSASTWNAAAAGSASNALTITFPTATGNWASSANMTYVVCYDALSSGNLLGFGALTTPQAVLNGNVAEFTAGNLTWGLT